MQEEALNQVNAELLHRLELLGTLHTFGDHHRAVIVREANHRLDEILLDEVRVDGVYERDVELDEIGLEVRDRAQPSVAAPRIVHREAKALLSEDLQPLSELWIVLDRRALGDLDDDTIRELHLVLIEHRIAEVVRIDVQEEQLIRLQTRLDPFYRSRSTQAAELPHQIGFGSDVEHDLWAA